MRGKNTHGLTWEGAAQGCIKPAAEPQSDLSALTQKAPLHLILSVCVPSCPDLCTIGWGKSSRPVQSAGTTEVPGLVDINSPQ